MSENITRCSACNVKVNNWETHIKTPTHIKNIERRRQEEILYLNEDCPLCTIPDREPLLFENKLVYLVPTKEMKGHKIRAMCAIYRHSTKPTFEELSYAYSALISYMETKTSKFYIAAPKKASVRNHWHLIACDDKFSDLDEKESLFTNPYIELPIKWVVSKE